jgi:hypothetical protein
MMSEIDYISYGSSEALDVSSGSWGATQQPQAACIALEPNSSPLMPF